MAERREVSHELIVFVDHDGLVVLGELEPFVEPLGRVHVVPLSILVDGLVERLALPVDLVFELFLGPIHELGNGMLNRRTLDDLVPVPQEPLTER